MPYYPTLAEDVARAKEILARGKADPAEMPVAMRDVAHVPGGTIFGCDTYAAYKLLESFVAAIEAVGPKVCELALRVQQRAAGEPPRIHAGPYTMVLSGPQPSITCPRCGMTSYHPKDISERYCGACHLFHDQMEPLP